MPTQKYISLARQGVYKLHNKLSPAARAQRYACNNLRQHFYQQFWQTSTQQIGADLHKLSDGWWKASKEGQRTFIQGERVMLDSAVALDLAGNKALIYQLLAEDNYPVPQSLVFSQNNLSNAYEFQKKIEGNVVVKPMASWAGQGVTVNIKTAEELKKTAIYASRFGNKLLIEQHIAGDSYRLLFLNGEFIDAIRRDPPHVKGDAKLNIKQLIEEENKRRLNTNNITALSLIAIDTDCKQTLKKQNLSLKSIPENNEMIKIKTVVNHNNRFENHSVKNQVHPDIIKLGRNISLQYHIELAGLDIITSDITKALSKTGGVINEINTTPGLHHHALVADNTQTTSVGSLVLDYIFSKSTLNRNSTNREHHNEK